VSFFLLFASRSASEIAGSFCRIVGFQLESSGRGHTFIVWKARESPSVRIGGAQVAMETAFAQCQIQETIKR